MLVWVIKEQFNVIAYDTHNAHIMPRPAFRLYFLVKHEKQTRLKLPENTVDPSEPNYAEE